MRIKDRYQQLALVEVSLPDGSQGAAEKWYEIALEGTWKGYSKGSFTLSPKTFEEICFNNALKGTETVVDYQHATLIPGEEAPAAGWIKALELRYRESDGKATLWALIAWNQRAADAIRKREFRYLSPVIDLESIDPVSGEKRGAYLQSLALTNTPFLTELPEVTLSRNPIAADEALTKEKNMDEFLKALAAKLKLETNATREQVEAAIAQAVALNEARAAAISALYQRLELTDKATTEEAVAKIVALRSPDGMVPAARLIAAETKIVELENKARSQEVEQLIGEAQQKGKLTAAKESVDWFRTMALKDIASAKAFIEHAPKVVPVDQVKRHEEQRAPKQVELSELGRKYAGQMGLTDEDIKNYGPMVVAK